MTKKEILEKVIWKALKGGWEVGPYRLSELWSNLNCDSLDYKTFIFNHDFAKAFFGEEDETYEILDMDFSNSKPKWKNSLEKMVLKEEPLKYLERFVCEHIFEEDGEPYDFCLKCNIKRYLV